MILVTGSTGNNGSQIVNALAGLRRQTRALVRSPQKEAQKVDAMKCLGVEIAEGDLAKPETLRAALEGVDTALLLSPVNPNQVELQGNFIDAAKQAGVRHIVKFSMIGAAENSPVPLSRWHWQTEQLLEKSGIAWTHLRPNDLMRYNTQLLLPTVLKEGAIYDSLGDARISMVDEEDVAEAAALCLTEAGHEGKTYTLTGPEPLSFYDVAKHLSKAFGKEVAYHPISPDQAAQAMAAGGLPQPAVALVTALRAYEREGHNAILTSTLQSLLGRPPAKYSDVAVKVAAAQRAAA